MDTFSRLSARLEIESLNSALVLFAFPSLALPSLSKVVKSSALRKLATDLPNTSGITVFADGCSRRY